MPTSFTSQNVTSDLVKYEVEPRYTREVVSVTLNTAGKTSALGVPVAANGAEILSTGEANVKGIVISDKKIDATATALGNLLIIKRGPAILNKNLLPAADSAGDAYNLANLIAAYEALGIVFVEEPAKQEVQST